jgi:hypothetical protein
MSSYTLIQFSAKSFSAIDWFLMDIMSGLNLSRVLLTQFSGSSPNRYPEYLRAGISISRIQGSKVMPENAQDLADWIRNTRPWDTRPDWIRISQDSHVGDLVFPSCGGES